MSADLFAEFGAGSTSAQPSGRPRQENCKPQAGSLIPDLEAPGDVFSASSWTRPPTWTAQHSDIPQGQPVRNQVRQYDENVLFDASLETGPDDGSEDWGEFESPETLPPQSQPTRQARGTERDLNLVDSLLIEDESPSVHVTPIGAITRNTQAKKTQTQTKLRASATRVDALQDQWFDDWDEFEDSAPSNPSTQVASKEAPGKKMVEERKTVTSKKNLVKSESGVSNPPSKHTEPASLTQVRPTNIPPPSVLLQMFPRLFEQLRQEATRANRNAQQNTVSEATTSHIAVALKTAARVIAGRSARWKRDSILSQSMRIGPARSGKPGGMKLNTINKNESVKEQQEVVDVLEMWRDRTALFNSVLQGAGQRPIPVIAENTRITTATSSQGAIKAPHACALCGLKRDERLPKIDEKVEDSFGEWWTDHWGHTDCKRFWQTNMILLDQR